MLLPTFPMGWMACAVALLVALPSGANAQALPCDVPGALRAADPARHRQAVNRLASLLEERAGLERLPEGELAMARLEYDRRRGEHKAQLLVALDAAAEALAHRTEAMREQIAQVPMASAWWTRDIEAWMRRGTDTRERARDDAYFAALDLTLARMVEAASRMPAPGAKELGGVRDWVSRYGQDAMSAGAVRVAAERLRRARSWEEVAGALDYIRAQCAAFFRRAGRLRASDEAEEREKWGVASLELIEAIVRLSGMDPYVAAAGRTVQLWSDAYYGWAAGLALESRLTELAELPGPSYAPLIKLSRQYIDEHRRGLELRRARRLLAQLVC